MSGEKITVDRSVLDKLLLKIDGMLETVRELKKQVKRRE